MTKPVLVWFRQDLRTEDQPALHAAVESGRPVIPVYIWGPQEEGNWPPGAASCFWLHQSLSALAKQLTALGSPLVIRQGPALKILKTLIQETGSEAVYWNRRYEPAAITRDTQVKTKLRAMGIEVKSFNGRLLFEPGSVATKGGTPFKVFTPFYNSCMSRDLDTTPLPKPRKLVPPSARIPSDSLDVLRLEPTLDWAAGIRSSWTFGEAAAQARADSFLDATVLKYKTGRDHPAETGVSRLSPHLHFGEISPRWLVHRAYQAANERPEPGRMRQTEEFIREVYWREFSYHLLFHFPHTPEKPLREEFSAFRWKRSKAHLRAWQRGLTGYPIVDAGMRELWTTGWMHNRVRMITASFLIKDLLIHWKEGARWFWDTLTDADLANNTQGWQWTAGSGADAAPYFRIFNPMTQGERFDPKGVYVRRYVPELASLPDKYLHRPWEAPPEVLLEAGVTLGKQYPDPIVNHAEARKEALDRYGELKE